MRQDAAKSQRGDRRMSDDILPTHGAIGNTHSHEKGQRYMKASLTSEMSESELFFSNCRSHDRARTVGTIHSRCSYHHGWLSGAARAGDGLDRNSL